MDFREIEFATADYQRTLALRQQVLRQPLGLELSAADLDGEAAQRHFGLFEQGELIACVVVKPTATPAHAKLRQMAVAERCRGSGSGRQLLQAVEAQLRRDGVRSLELSARKVAEGFYQKLGYQAVGPVYLELGIEHIKMEKSL